MSARLNEFGREYSKRTVIGGECLIQFCHFATDCRGRLYQIDTVAQLSKVKGGLHTRYTSTHYHYRPHFFIVCLRSVLIHVS